MAAVASGSHTGRWWAVLGGRGPGECLANECLGVEPGAFEPAESLRQDGKPRVRPHEGRRCGTPATQLVRVRRRLLACTVVEAASVVSRRADERAAGGPAVAVRNVVVTVPKRGPPPALLSSSGDPFRYGAAQAGAEVGVQPLIAARSRRRSQCQPRWWGSWSRSVASTVGTRGNQASGPGAAPYSRSDVASRLARLGVLVGEELLEPTVEDRGGIGGLVERCSVGQLPTDSGGSGLPHLALRGDAGGHLRRGRVIRRAALRKRTVPGRRGVEVR